MGSKSGGCNTGTLCSRCKCVKTVFRPFTNHVDSTFRPLLSYLSLLSNSALSFQVPQSTIAFLLHVVCLSLFLHLILLFRQRVRRMMQLDDWHEFSVLLMDQCPSWSSLYAACFSKSSTPFSVTLHAAWGLGVGNIGLGIPHLALVWQQRASLWLACCTLQSCPILLRGKQTCHAGVAGSLYKLFICLRVDLPCCS